MIEYLQDIDTQVFLYLNGLHTAFLDHFMMIATGRFIWIPFYAALFGVMWMRLGWRRALVWLVAIGVAIAAADQLCATFLRPIFQRLRPANLENPISELVTIVDGYRGGRYGFPSCHGANSFALVALYSLIMRKRLITLTLVVWAILNCYTRIYLGVHYVGDILVGSCIGALIGCAVYFPAKLLADRLPSHDFGYGRAEWLAPAVFAAEVVGVSVAVMCL